jgi:hypothetical protein
MTVALDEDLLAPMLADWLIATGCALMCSVRLLRSLP